MRVIDVTIGGKRELGCGYGDVGMACALVLSGSGARFPICALQACTEKFEVAAVDSVVSEMDNRNVPHHLAGPHEEDEKQSCRAEKRTLRQRHLHVWLGRHGGSPKTKYNNLFDIATSNTQMCIAYFSFFNGSPDYISYIFGMKVETSAKSFIHARDLLILRRTDVPIIRRLQGHWKARPRWSMKGESKIAKSWSRRLARASWQSRWQDHWWECSHDSWDRTKYFDSKQERWTLPTHFFLV